MGDDARAEPGEARAGALEDIDDTAEVAEQECRGEAAERAADDGDAEARLTIDVDGRIALFASKRECWLWSARGRLERGVDTDLVLATGR